MSYLNYRFEDISFNLEKMEVIPLDIMVTGVTGAGKSSTLNAIFQKDIAKIGYGVEPETMKSTGYILNDSLRLWDTPGLGDSIKKDTMHAKNMINLLHKTYTNGEETEHYGWIDMVLVILDGSTRDMGMTYKLLNEVIVPNFPSSKILVAVNQADMVMKGRNWDNKLNEPMPILKNALEEKVQSIQRRVLESTAISIIKPIYYSAYKEYNIEALLDFIIDNMPQEKREYKEPTCP